jgi:hypothetical protein
MQEKLEQRAEIGAVQQSCSRRIPWWLWLCIAVSVMLFIGFFLTFAIGVTSGTSD